MEFVFEILALAALAVCVVCFLGLLTERYKRRENRRIIRSAIKERWLPLALLLFASAAAMGQDNWVWHGCKPLSNGGYSLDPRCPNYGSYPTEQDNGVPHLSPWKSDYSRHVMTEEEMKACDCQLSGAERQVEIQPNEVQRAKPDYVETIVYGPPVTLSVIELEPKFDPAEFMAEFAEVIYYGDFPDGHMYVAEIPSAKRQRRSAKLAANLPQADNTIQARCIQWMFQHNSIGGAEEACTKQSLIRSCASHAKYDPTLSDFDGFAKAVDCPQYALRPRGGAAGSGEVATVPPTASHKNAVQFLNETGCAVESSQWSGNLIEVRFNCPGRIRYDLTPLQRLLGSPMLAGLRF